MVIQISRKGKTTELEIQLLRMCIDTLHITSKTIAKIAIRRAVHMSDLEAIKKILNNTDLHAPNRPDSA